MYINTAFESIDMNLLTTLTQMRQQPHGNRFVTRATLNNTCTMNLHYHQPNGFCLYEL